MSKTTRWATVLLAAFAAAALPPDPVTIHMAGDSTMAPKVERRRPETGWGEAFAELLDPSRFVVDNRAVNGRSTTSFIAEGRWQALLDVTKPGDWVFIQFGHNDEKVDSPTQYASPDDYRRHLRDFVADVRAKQATPVLLTSVMRRSFDESGQFYDTHGVYPDIVREVAADLDVDLIDMHRLSRDLLVSLGPERSKALYLILAPGEHPNYPDGNEDNTHFRTEGAHRIAELAIGPFMEIVAKRQAGR